ncbi:MAG: hypothetical protein EPN72_14985 [Nevskiaceae bacterium]|nr:MAG: hypothetical protein EPN72_14985 [Nevskiaceae bacterium]
MIPTTVAQKTQVIIEHLDDASDCCREASETLQRVSKVCKQIDVSAMRSQLEGLGRQITDMRATFHRDAYPSTKKIANSIFPIAQPSHLIPL